MSNTDLAQVAAEEFTDGAMRLIKDIRAAGPDSNVFEDASFGIRMLGLADILSNAREDYQKGKK